MSIAILMAMASCSSSDDAVAENKAVSKLVPMTFTATQESNAETRSALNGSNAVDWQTNDKISVFDAVGDGHNQRFTLTGYATEGKFSGEASSEATQFTAVYPYTSEATLESDGVVNGITLPAVQTATPNSFDPTTALMMAYSTDKSKLDFKNAVSLVKVTTQFACKKIVLSANEDIAGTGKLTYNSGEPSITFESNQSQTITLKPATDGGEIAAGTYYIVVPAITLNDFSISFHASDEYCVYTRTSTRSNTFNRSKIKDFGTFMKTGNTWEWSHTSRGDKVTAAEEVDMGVFNIGGTKYRLIFTKSNLTTTGLATNESDYGDYFAFAAKEPWYTSYTGTTINGWKNDYSTYGYDKYNTPYYNSNNASYTKYTDGNTLDMNDDAANVILGGDWQIPTRAIWQALINISTKGWDNGYKFTNNGQTLSLPAAGYVSGKIFHQDGSEGRYWSGTASSGYYAYRLSFSSKKLNADNLSRDNGCPVRPVRLVAVD